MRLTIALLISAIIIFGSAQPAAAEEACGDYLIIGAAGTGYVYNAQDLGMGPEAFQFATKMQDILQATGSTNVELEGLAYPAILFRTEFISGTPVPQGYFDSVREGANSLIARIAEKYEDRGDATQFILSGYSQGADVVRTALRDLDSNTTQDAYDQIAGIAVIGDGYFDPADEAASGSYNPKRFGFWGPTDTWADLTEAPVVSMCRHHDAFCQARHRDSDVATAGPLYVGLPELITHANSYYGGNIFGVHETYDDLHDGDKAARQLGEKMGLQYTLDDGWGPSDPVDVAIVVDSTGNASGSVLELQTRAAEFVNLVTDNVQDARIAVVDYKSGGSITTTNPYAVNIASNFNDDPQAAIDAIVDIQQGGRATGAIYSAVAVIDDLPWREGVRKITLTLAGSRACATAQYCDREDGSGESYPVYIDRDRPSFLRAAGVYTRDHIGLFERAGWSAIMEDPWLSRPGTYGTDSTFMIDELKRVFTNALTYLEDPISGNDVSFVGGSGSFNASTVIPYLAGTQDPNRQWSVVFDPFPSGDDDLPTDSRPSAPDESDPDPEPDPEPEPEPEPLPADMGPIFEVDFDQPGLYTIRLSALIDGEIKQYSTSVRVDAVPTEPPASPLLTSFVDAGSQVLAWTPGDGEAATYYNVIDGEGDVISSLAPVATIGLNGVVDFEVTVPLATGEPANYSIVAANPAGETAATAVLRADQASYEHAVDSNAVLSGRILTLSGPSTPELDAIAARLDAAQMQPSVAGPYHSTFVSPSGARFDVGMTAINASMNLSDGFELEISLGDIEDTSGSPVWETMRDGFAEELLLGGYIDMKISGDRVRIKVSPTAATSQPGEYVIDSGSTPPTGAVATEISASPEYSNLYMAHTGDVDPALLPLVGEANDPAFDWSTATALDVRTWIGAIEMTNSLQLSIAEAYPTNATDPGRVAISLSGDVGSGDYLTMREFLAEGTISFRVGTGLTNSLSLQVAATEANDAYPAPIELPTFVGSATAQFVQYRDVATWKPVVRWGSEGVGSVIYEGEFPWGIYVEDWETGQLGGMPMQQGTFPVTVTVTNDAGQVTRDYNIVVGPNSSDAALALRRTTLWNNGDGTVDVLLRGKDFYRSDNPNTASRLPIISQLEQAGYINGTLDSLSVLDPNGVPIVMSGTFNIEMYQSGPDYLSITSQDAVFGDNSAPSLAAALGAGATVSFVYDGGPTNTVQLGPLNLFDF